jgi:RHS repeat-associated protein
MNKTRMRKLVEMAAMLAVLVLFSMFHPHVAHAAGGQCKWEGGPGAGGGYGYCKAEDCLGSGGTAMCTAGVGATNDTWPVGPDSWVYMACPDSGPSIPLDAMWCGSAGGHWQGPEVGCTGLPSGFLGNSGMVADNEGTLEGAAAAYKQCPKSGDTGWGGHIDSYNCWSGDPTYKLGIFVQDHRRIDFSGPSCGGSVYLLKQRDAKCPEGYRMRGSGSNQQCWRPIECCSNFSSKPVSFLSGAKAFRENDYQSPVDSGLILTRFYLSTGYFRPTGLSTTIDTTDKMLPQDFWRISYDRRLYAVADNAELSATVQRADGSLQSFDSAGVEMGNLTGGAARLQFDAASGWDLTLGSQDVEHYNLAGKLTSIRTRTGRTTTLTYNATSGVLDSVTDAFGHTLTLTHDADGLLTAITQPDGGQIQYAYDRWHRLTTVTYPDSTTRTYAYGDTRNQWLITAINDESGQQYGTYSYDAQGRVTSEFYGTGADSYSFSYSAGGDGSTVTDPAGAVTQWTYSAANGVYKPSAHTQKCLGCGDLASASYDENGNPNARTDFNGNQTLFLYDSTRNLETWRTEAAGTPQARAITTQWHPTYRVPTEIDQPGQRTNFSYDTDGNLLTRTITDLATNATRTWTYTYNSQGQVLTEDGPRTDVSDVTTYTYNTCTSGNGCGQLATITDAAGNVTQFLSYDANGNPLTFSDPNGVVTTLAYDARQRLVSRVAGTETTTLEYWPTGLLKKTVLPDGSLIAYTYDGAHRLTGISDGEGNHIAYMLDSAGNHTQEDVYDPSNTLFTTRHQVFDTLGRLQQQTGAAGQVVSYDYDNEGNLLAATDPLSRQTLFSYDALNRQSAIIDPVGGQTQLAYDARDNLHSVTDPRNLQTTYTQNGFNDSVGLTSPDTGPSSYSPDSAGNPAQSTDARGRVGNYSYDALDRLTQVQYSDQSIHYTYDTGTNARGRLSSFSDGSGSTHYGFDSLGRIVSKSQTVGTVTSTISYGYNAAGQLTSTTTPSGQVIGYSYSNSRISGITVNGAPLLSNVLYAPFGPTRGWTWGNGTLTVREYDSDGRLTTIDSAGLTTYAYNADGTIASRSDDAPVPDNATASNLTLTVPSASNRIGSVLEEATSTTRSYTYDAAGNTLSDGLRTFTYNDAGRMASATLAGATTNYSYNALGQRVKKAGPSGTFHFAYDEGGHLLGVYDAAGARIEELVWFGDIPVATIRTSPTGGVGFFYIHTDNLNTPVRLTRQEDNAVMWRWDHDPYGGGATNDDADANNAFVFFNLRFAGQYFDAETGLNYNYFRDYDPASGRYLESDPIGLSAGPNTFGYVRGNPVALSDALGLWDTGGGPGRTAARIVGDALGRAGRVDVMGGGPENPAADIAAAAVFIGSVGTDIYLLCRESEECERLYVIAEAAKDIVVGRYFQLLYDRNDLYNQAFEVRRSRREGTWLGHVQQYYDAQRNLQKAINALLAAGCKPSKEQLDWASRAAPTMPINATRQKYPSK